jgi:hypothetical protein
MESQGDHSRARIKHVQATTSEVNSYSFTSEANSRSFLNSITLYFRILLNHLGLSLLTISKTTASILKRRFIMNIIISTLLDDLRSSVAELGRNGSWIVVGVVVSVLVWRGFPFRTISWHRRSLILISC